MAATTKRPIELEANGVDSNRNDTKKGSVFLLETCLRYFLDCCFHVGKVETGQAVLVDAVDPWCEEGNPRTIHFQDVSEAAFKLRGGIERTPCLVRLVSFVFIFNYDWAVAFSDPPGFQLLLVLISISKKIFYKIQEGERTCDRFTYMKLNDFCF